MSTPNTAKRISSRRIKELRALTKAAMAGWKKNMAKAAREQRSTDERFARDAVIWLNGYQKALEDVRNERPVTHGAEMMNRTSTHA